MLGEQPLSKRAQDGRFGHQDEFWDVLATPLGGFAYLGMSVQALFPPSVKLR